MGCGIHVFKKPRGIISVLKFVTALAAACTTLAFSTKIEFNIPCNGELDKTVYISVSHPYKMLKFEDSDNDRRNLKCDNDEELRMMRSIKLPFDYARTASFFATCAIVSMSFTFAILFVSMLVDPEADNLKKVLVIDFGITAVAALLWLALSSAWAQGAFDLMHYLHPETLFNFLSICITDDQEHSPKCQIVENATYDVLYASVVLGFVNVLLWLCNLWFIYKEIISCQPSETKTDKEKNANSEEVGKNKHTKRSSDDAVDNDPRNYAKGGAAVNTAAAIAVIAELLRG